MRLDAANRSFFALVALAAVPYAIIGIAGCGAVAVAAYQVAVGGFDGVGLSAVPALAVTVLVTVGTVRAAWSWRAQTLATARLVRKLEMAAVPYPPRLQDAAVRAGLADRVDLVKHTDAFSFTYGLGRPRVAASIGLLEAVSDDELDAVLAHERYHVANRDPLKVVTARALSAALFFLPALRGLRARYTAASELAADRRALRTSDRAALAGALFRAVRGPAWDELATAAAIGGPDLLEVRVAQLETGEAPPLATLPTWQVVLTGVVLAALAAVFVAAVTVGADAMGGMDAMDDDMGSGVVAAVAGPAVWGAVIAVAVWLQRRGRRSVRP